MGITRDVVAGPDRWLERTWTATCQGVTDFTSIAKSNLGIAFTRIDDKTTVTIRGPETKAETWLCLPAEFYGVELRLGARLRMFAPSELADLHDVDLPVRADGTFELGGMDWELPRPDNVDVFMDRLERAGLLVFDPVAEDLCHDIAVPGVARRTAQERVIRAVGISRRKLRAIQRAREAACQLRAGLTMATVVACTGYYDQPHLARAMRHYLGHTPTELARRMRFVDL